MHSSDHSYGNGVEVPGPFASGDAGAALARLLHGLTPAVLALPIDEHDTDIHPEDADELRATDEAPAAPVRERRTGSLLAELTFLDD